jgi:hypothetical protein
MEARASSPVSDRFSNLLFDWSRTDGTLLASVEF